MFGLFNLFLCFLVWCGFFEVVEYFIECGWDVFSELWMFLLGKILE